MRLEAIPTLMVEGWTDEQIKAYVLVDNRLAENAAWDRHLLGLEISSLSTAGFDTKLLGWEGGDVRARIARAIKT